MRIISNEYKTSIVDYFVNDAENNDYYIFGSTIDSDVVLTNAVADKREFLNKTIFGKKVDPAEVFAAIKNYPWQPGEVYTQYDDIADMTGKKFYTVVYPMDSNTGSYLIFKCLFNNYDAVSQFPPFYQSLVADQIYRLADGYVWKFMYSISVEDFEKYNAYGYIPVKSEPPIFIDSKSISHIQVENQSNNFGYLEYSGTIREVNSTEILIVPDTGSSIEEQRDYYNGQTLYVSNNLNDSKVYDIVGYRFIRSTGRGRISVDNLDDFITPGSKYKILPKVKIVGDGIGAVGIPIIESNSIKQIIMIEAGTGYNTATASIVDPSYFSPGSTLTSDERANIRPILSPGIGHGMDVAGELQSEAVLFTTRITPADILAETIPAGNTYSRIGLVKNPEFKSVEPVDAPDSFDNRIYVELETENFFEYNSRVFQQSPTTSEITFEAIVHEIGQNGIYLAEYVGQYRNVDPTDVSFDPNLPLRNEQNQINNINTSIEQNPRLSNYVQRTGEVLYLASFAEPITRTITATEQYKIVLQF